MTDTELLNAIAENFLCVRRLPFEVINHWSGYQEGDEHKKWVNSKGNPSKSKREVVVLDYDLEHFKNTKPVFGNKETPEKRLADWKKKFPEGRKLLKETRPVEKGGWWYVKPVDHTSETVRFQRKHDHFFAPTLKEAVQLYLNSKT